MRACCAKGQGKSQNCCACPYPFIRSATAAANCVFVCLATQSCDDQRFGGVGGHNFHAFQRASLDFGNGFFRFSRLGSNLFVRLGNRFVQPNLDFGAGFSGDALCLGTGVCQCFVISVFGLNCLGFQVFSRGEVVGDGPLTLGQNRSECGAARRATE